MSGESKSDVSLSTFIRCHCYSTGAKYGELFFLEAQVKRYKGIKSGNIFPLKTKLDASC